MAERPRDGEVRMVMSGPNVEPERAIEAGHHLAAALAAVAEGLGGPEGALRWEVGALRWMCDGCEGEVERIDKPASWINVGGLDYCPGCQEAM